MPDPASSKKKRYRIDFLCQGSIKSFPWKDKFDKMAHQLLDQEGTGNNVNVVLCDDDFVREMNKSYRGLDKVTDVLSYEWHEPDLLGELSGYDHIKAADRKVMRKRECEFLGLDPYKEKC